MNEPARAIAFLDRFSGREDRRRQWKLLYPLDRIVLVILCGVLSGADGFVEIAAGGPLLRPAPLDIIAASRGGTFGQGPGQGG